MPRVKRTVKDEYKVFSERLCQLIEEKGITQNQLAEIIGKTRQTINGYTLGNTAPDSDTLIELSNYFNVSVDYLLGLSNVKTLDVQVKSICEYTGLTEMAVLQLHAYKYGIEKVTALSKDCLQYSNLDYETIAKLNAVAKINAKERKKEKEIFIDLLNKLIVKPDFLKALNRYGKYILGKEEINHRYIELKRKLPLQTSEDLKNDKWVQTYLSLDEDTNGVNLYYAQKYLNKVIEQIADECVAKVGDD